MARKRTTLRASDLLEAPLVINAQGEVFSLGKPKKRNVNLNVVNHCQLYTADKKLVSERWYNLSNLRDAGFKLQ